MNYLGGIVIPTFTLKQRPKTIAQMTYQHICICINVYIYIYIYIYIYLYELLIKQKIQ